MKTIYARGRKIFLGSGRVICEREKNTLTPAYRDFSIFPISWLIFRYNLLNNRLFLTNRDGAKYPIITLLFRIFPISLIRQGLK